MPSGVILSSSSAGAKQEDVEKVLASAGLEVEKEEKEESAATTVEVEEEPNRDDFESEVEFEEAHVAWQDKQETAEKEAGDDEEEEEEEEEPKPAKVSKFKKRVEKIAAPLRREIDDLKRRLEAAEAKSGKKEEETPPADPNPRPVRANFDTDEKYEDALVAWGVKQALEKEALTDEQKKAKAAFESNLKNYRSEVEKFKAEHDDWDDVVGQDIPMHTGVQVTIMNPRAIKNPAEVIYYLGKHPEYAKEIAELEVEAAIAEVGRLSARLLKSGSASDAGRRGEKPKPKIIRRAPEPISPVRPSATTSTLTSADAAKARNYKAFKAAQRAGR